MAHPLGVKLLEMDGVGPFIALARQRHKVIYKLMTTETRYDKEVLMASHLNRLQGAQAA